jgi:hypothetical protein
MATLTRSRTSAAVISGLLVCTGLGCADRARVDASSAPISTRPLAPGDTVTHVNGEPVNDQAGAVLSDVPARGDVVYTVKRKDGRVERLGPAGGAGRARR